MNKNRKRLLAVLAVALLVAAAGTGTVLAKYVSNKAPQDIPVSAKAFYFESNYLTADGRSYSLNAGTRSVTIELYNYENDLRVSQVDCQYTVTVSSTDTGYTCSPTTAQTTADMQNKTTITLSNLKDGCSYTVTATAVGGYEKTLSATFTVAAEETGFYMNVADCGEYILLTLWTQNVSGELSVSVPAGLIPDATDEALARVGNYSEGTYSAFTFTDNTSFANTYASRAYRFFKAADYNGGDFTATIDNKTAEPAQIP